jgi:hypothetical protein
MDNAIVLQELEALAGDLEVEVRYDDLDGHGGLCRYGGRSYLIISHALALPERIHLLCKELSRFSLDDVFVRPQLRELIDSAPQTDQ